MELTGQISYALAHILCKNLSEDWCLPGPRHVSLLVLLELLLQEMLALSEIKFRNLERVKLENKQRSTRKNI